MTDTERIELILKGLRALRDLHNCDSVRTPGDYCPVCAMAQVLP